jgi:carbamoyl-phosphate synthase large subunit
MEVVYDEEMLRQYVAAAVDVTPERPILIDKFLENATESEADAICDGVNAYVPAVMEHIELAGITLRRFSMCNTFNNNSTKAS